MNALVIRPSPLPGAWPRLSTFAIVALAHVFIVYLLLLSPAREVIRDASALLVTLIRESPRATLEPAAPSKTHVAGLQKIQVATVPLPAVIIAADATAIAMAIATANSPERPAFPAVTMASRIEPPRFDVAYLNNPSPAYPPISRRLREQGKVWLKVRVSADGGAEQIHIHVSSGASRLDNAAIDAVRRWRFVPARRGDEAVAGWALVPINFQLS